MANDMDVDDLERQSFINLINLEYVSFNIRNV